MNAHAVPQPPAKQITRFPARASDVPLRRLRSYVHAGRVYIDTYRGREQVYALHIGLNDTAHAVPITYRDQMSPSGESNVIRARLARQQYNVQLEDLLIDPVNPPKEPSHPLPGGSLAYDREQGITESRAYFVQTDTPGAYLFRSDVFERFTTLSEASKLRISKALRGDVIACRFGAEIIDFRRIL